MEEQNRYALKEWAVIEQALATGEVCLLLRKGGLWERREGFEIEHREFWVFPTWYHQNPEELAPHLHGLVDSAPTSPSGDQVRIAHYVVVEDALRVENLDALRRLEALHPLTQATVESRFAYRNRPYLHAVLVRVFAVPEPHVIRNTLGYEGCISWVELDEALPTHGAVPVLGDAEFAARREEILERLGEEGVVRV